MQPIHMHNSINCFFKHCPYQTVMLFFRRRGSEPVTSFRLQHIAVARQVHSCSCPFEVFYQSTCKLNIVYHLHFKKEKSYFQNNMTYWLPTQGGRIIYMVGNGTMICVDGGGSIANVKSNNLGFN